MSRKIFIAGNWKMNTTKDEAVSLAESVVKECAGIDGVEVAVCPPYISLDAVSEVVKGTNVKLGAQDLHWEAMGAYTGKVNTEMLRSVGVEYVIIGHSEQRTYFQEIDETVNKKLKAALSGGLSPIVCIGETLEERKGGKTEDVVSTQVKGGFSGISKEQVLKCTIAYEPVWAIGTGETATPEQAEATHKYVRGIFADQYGSDIAEKLCMQYGGSMKPANAGDLLGQPDIDGGLIGGASLKSGPFSEIVKAGRA